MILVPTCWEETTLGEVIELKYGKALPAKNRDGVGFPVYGSNGIVGKHSEPLVDREGLIVGRKGSFGEVHIANSPFSPIDTTYFVDELHGQPLRYWFHFLKHLPLTQLNRSTAIPGLNREDAYAQSIELPGENEQHQIAAKLDELLAQVDSIKARLDAIPAILKRFRHSVLAAAVSGRLTEDWREEHPNESTEAALKDFEPLPRPPRYSSRSKSFIQGVTATAVGRPESSSVESWAWVPIVEVARMESGHTPSRSKHEYWGGEVPWIGIKDAREFHSKTITSTFQHTNELGLANSASRLLPKDTVCISRTASVGYVVKMGVPMATSQDFVNWVPSKVVDPDWLKWLFVAEKESLFKFGKGSTHTTIYFPEWLSMHILMPPLAEQKVIARRVEEYFQFAELVEARVRQAIEKVAGLDRAILAKAFRGELTADWRRNNPSLISGKNSAETLLARIRDQQARTAKPKSIRGRSTRKNTGAKIPMIISVLDALKKHEQPLNAQRLLAEAGYAKNASTEDVERFMLDIRECLDGGKIRRERRGDQDVFSLVD